MPIGKMNWVCNHTEYRLTQSWVIRFIKIQVSSKQLQIVFIFYSANLMKSSFSQNWKDMQSRANSPLFLKGADRVWEILQAKWYKRTFSEVSGEGGKKERKSWLGLEKLLTLSCHEWNNIDPSIQQKQGEALP